MKVTMYLWRGETTKTPEIRENVPWSLAQAYGLNSGFYKVQAVLDTGEVFTEWKQPLTS